MLRRRVLAIGLAGAVAALAEGCGQEDAADSSDGAGQIGDETPLPTYDPSTYDPPKIDIAQLRKLYTYDQKAKLDASLTDQQVERGLRIEDLTYTGAKDATVPLYIVSPYASRGLVPGVVFAVDAGATRDGLLTEVTELAKLGIVGAVPGVEFEPTGDPQTDSTMMINAVIAQQRALDLLAKRSDVDSSRLAVVGFGWGGAQAQIMSGLDTRLSGVVSVASGGRWSRVAYRAAKPAEPGSYMEAMTRFDGVRYLSVSGKRSVLLQFGKMDSDVSSDDADEATQTTVGTKERTDYDAAHDLTAIQTAVADRKTFLRQVLKIGS
ncbi:MAG: hypothetical protein HKP61_10315 [Dactylosporangium sp.]|nr:hypothetical protein [Dactylosporangium sp.]NNJ61323.1 hypothetical protein [Dactylosporangium sp.]